MRRARRELRHFLAILDDADVAVVEDVEGVAKLALLDDELVLGEVHFDERRCDLLLLILQQGLEIGDTVQVLHVLLDLVIGDLHQDVLEVLTVDDPNYRILLGLDRSGSRHEVEQGQLSEAASLGDGGDDLGLALGLEVVGPGALLLLGDEDVEASILYDVKVVRVQVALLDDVRASSHLLLPHDVDETLDPRVVQCRDRLQVLISPDGT
mmetsp:Transcript_114833/g.364963  ORF Transcript_114833/g.364963 Transcript_114833/m.364963 type:complete len:210 (-) Transcript_114833:680-1309(-)